LRQGHLTSHASSQAQEEERKRAYGQELAAQIKYNEEAKRRERDERLGRHPALQASSPKQSLSPHHDSFSAAAAPGLLQDSTADYSAGAHQAHQYGFNALGAFRDRPLHSEPAYTSDPAASAGLMLPPTSFSADPFSQASPYQQQQQQYSTMPVYASQQALTGSYGQPTNAGQQQQQQSPLWSVSQQYQQGTQHPGLQAQHFPQQQHSQQQPQQGYQPDAFLQQPFPTSSFQQPPPQQPQQQQQQQQAGRLGIRRDQLTSDQEDAAVARRKEAQAAAKAAYRAELEQQIRAKEEAKRAEKQVGGADGFEGPSRRGAA
jgi:hypothetical protein